MYYIGILRGAATARFVSVVWLRCSRLLLLHQTALTAKRAEAARAVTPILALNGLNGGRRFFAMQSDAIRTQRFADSQIPLAPRVVAVGTEITLRPPHRSRRALLTHRAPTLDGDEEPLLWPRMQDTWKRQVPVRDRLHSSPRQSVPLAAAHESFVPAFDHVMAEC